MHWMSVLYNDRQIMECNLMWYAIAFGVSFILPTNGIFLSLWHGVFGRLYIVYWLVRYYHLWYPWIKNVIMNH